MIKATSPAAKSSPIITEAIRAIETRTSAFISKAVIRPITASAIIGRPHKIMATHAISKEGPPHQIYLKEVLDLK